MSSSHPDTPKVHICLKLYPSLLGANPNNQTEIATRRFSNHDSEDHDDYDDDHARQSVIKFKDCEEDDDLEREVSFSSFLTILCFCMKSLEQITIDFPPTFSLEILKVGSGKSKSRKVTTTTVLIKTHLPRLMASFHLPQSAVRL